MARGTSLLALTTMVRDEIGRATSVAVSTDDISSLQQKLRRTQELLYDDYDWPFLRKIFTKIPLTTPSQYYDFPSDLNLERVEEVHVWYSNIPVPIERGIEMSDYAIYDSSAGTMSEPAQKWDVRWTGTREQVEIWPLPVSNTQSLQFTGIRKLRALIANSDVADLDDQMLSLLVAAEELARQGNESAPAVLKMGQGRLAGMKKRVKGASKTYRMGLGTTSHDPRFPITVRARST